MQLVSYRNYFISLFLFLTGCNADLYPPLSSLIPEDKEDKNLSVMFELQEKTVVIYWVDATAGEKKEERSSFNEEWIHQKIQSIRDEVGGVTITVLIKTTGRTKVEQFTRLLAVLKKNGIEKIGVLRNE